MNSSKGNIDFFSLPNIYNVYKGGEKKSFLFSLLYIRVGEVI